MEGLEGIITKEEAKKTIEESLTTKEEGLPEYEIVFNQYFLPEFIRGLREVKNYYAGLVEQAYNELREKGEEVEIKGSKNTPPSRNERSYERITLALEDVFPLEASPQREEKGIEVVTKNTRISQYNIRLYRLVLTERIIEELEKYSKRNGEEKEGRRRFYFKRPESVKRSGDFEVAIQQYKSNLVETIGKILEHPYIQGETALNLISLKKYIEKKYNK